MPSAALPACLVLSILILLMCTNANAARTPAPPLSPLAYANYSIQSAYAREQRSDAEQARA